MYSWNGRTFEEILNKYEDSIIIGIDQDLETLEKTNSLKEDFPNRFNTKKLNFSEIDLLDTYLKDNFKDFKEYDLILADLGFSSFQLDNPERGLSFKLDGPLDMRLDKSSKTTAASLLNNLNPTELNKVLAIGGVGQERKYVITQILNNRPFSRTSELSDLCDRVFNAGRGRGKGVKKNSSDNKNKLTSTVFQALRIAVNDEFQSLVKLLHKSISRIGPDGRIIIISFHSGEDKLVAGSMRWWQKREGKGIIQRMNL